MPAPAQIPPLTVDSEPHEPIGATLETRPRTAARCQRHATHAAQRSAGRGSARAAADQAADPMSQAGKQGESSPTSEGPAVEWSCLSLRQALCPISARETRLRNVEDAGAGRFWAQRRNLRLVGWLPAYACRVPPCRGQALDRSSTSDTLAGSVRPAGGLAAAARSATGRSIATLIGRRTMNVGLWVDRVASAGPAHADAAHRSTAGLATAGCELRPRTTCRFARFPLPARDHGRAHDRPRFR